MPRPKRPRTPGPNAVLASAARVTGTRRNIPRAGGKSQTWQQEAWRMLDITGELAFGATYVANALSRCRLVVDRAVRNDDGTWGREDVTDPSDPAVTIMEELFDGEAGQPQMLGGLGLHLFVPGDAWLFGVVNPPPYVDPWRILATTELSELGGRWKVDRGDGSPEEYRQGTGALGDEPEAIAIRIWRPHPAKYAEATSPVRAALPVLRQIEGLSQHTAANIDSRLAGAGILVVPSEITLGSPNPVPSADPETAPASPDSPEEDPLLSNLMDAMLAPIGDRGVASAVVPLLLKAPGQYLQHIKHIKFDTQLDTEAREQTDANIRRLALSLDLPPEVLLGQSDSNHWSGWLISEDTVKVHIEPPGELIANAILTQYLWPALQVADPTIYGLHCDTSALRQRPDLSANAITLHERIAISDDALLRHTGMDPADAPDDDERKRRLVEKLVMGGDAALTAAALDYLGVAGVEAPEPPPAALPAAAPTVTGEVVTPTPQQAPRNPPEQQAPTVASGVPPEALLAAATLLVGRAVERANNRFTRGTRKAVVRDRAAIEEALRDAWGAVPGTAELLGVSPDGLRERLHAYAVRVLETGADHSPDALRRLLLPLLTREDPAA